MPRLGETVPNPASRKYNEDVKNYTPAELKQHHDEALAYFIQKKGEVSIPVLSRRGKVPPGYIRQWMKDENWVDMIMEDPGDKIQTSKSTKEFVEKTGRDFGLTEQEEKFCYHFYKTKNATMAANRAGYGISHSPQVGDKLLHQKKIQEFLRAIQAQACQEVFVETLDIIRMWAKIAFADMNDYVQINTNGVGLRSSAVTDGQIITEIKEGRDGITIKLADKMKALDRLSSYLQVLPGDKAQQAKLVLLQKAGNSDDENDEPLRIEIVGV